ncbi:ArsA family ATPase [Bacillus tianshenii]|nr:ArsA family ATPase [Bacillus tianshenii]
MKQLLDKEIVFIGGKGGVGKSTSAAAFALQAANSGKKTLLVSTDPAHNTGDIFHKKLSGTISTVSNNLDAVEIDEERETKAYIKQVKSNLKGNIKAHMLEEVHRQIDLAAKTPGAAEAALFDRMTSLILEERSSYDLLVFDTAPTGHTVRLLTLPELMGAWIDGMLERRQKRNENYTQLLNDGEPVEDPIFEVLQERRTRFRKVRELLMDDSRTGFAFVLNPERLPILETAKAIELLSAHQLTVQTLIINKVLPHDADGSFFQKRRLQEKEYIEKIKKEFSNQEKVWVPFFSEDISDIEKLKQFSIYLL